MRAGLCGIKKKNQLLIGFALESENEIDQSNQNYMTLIINLLKS